MDVTQFSWVSNPAKALRAAAELKKADLAVTEAAVKELYVKYGGLVLEENPVEEVEEEEKPKAKKK